MSERKRTFAEIIQDAREALVAAQRGLDELASNDPRRKRAGLRNVAVFGRSVTFILQNLRTTVGDEFDDWYAPYRKEMGTDDLMRFFVRLRNKFEKVGTPVEGASYGFRGETELPTDAARWAPPPPGATGFFIDALGPGWVVNVSGESAKFYVEFPPERVSVDLVLSSPPSNHQGKPIGGASALDLAKMYLGYLEGLIANAAQRFAGA